MNKELIQTENLKLVLQTPEDLRAQIEGMTLSEKAELSVDWLKLVRDATSADPWVHGFALVHRASDAVIGTAGYKGPPTADGIVEIAYGVAANHRGKGYATEAARALVSYAFDNKIRIVRAHTLAELNASTRVLTKCGFLRVGEVMDPDDGLVWRWEKSREAS